MSSVLGVGVGNTTLEARALFREGFIDDATHEPLCESLGFLGRDSDLLGHVTNFANARGRPQTVLQETRLEKQDGQFAPTLFLFGDDALRRPDREAFAVIPTGMANEAPLVVLKVAGFDFCVRPTTAPFASPFG